MKSAQHPIIPMRATDAEIICFLFWSSDCGESRGENCFDQSSSLIVNSTIAPTGRTVNSRPSSIAMMLGTVAGRTVMVVMGSTLLSPHRERNPNRKKLEKDL